MRAIPLLAELFQYKPLRILFPWLTKMFLLIRVKGKFWRFNKINWLKKRNSSLLRLKLLSWLALPESVTRRELGAALGTTGNGPAPVEQSVVTYLVFVLLGSHVAYSLS